MTKRIKLADRVLPTYSIGEEIMNTATHLLGLAGGILALILCVQKANTLYGATEITASAIYGSCLLLLYAASSLYHGMKPSMTKKVLQIIDHCAIYFLIAGSYTVISLGAIRRADPMLGWGLFFAEWTLAIIATVLTAIDLHAYQVFSMICYIGMGWGVLPFIRQVYAILSPVGFYLLLAGGIAYTVGAVLYGIGSKVKWMHTVFHVMVVLGSVLHFFAFYFYGL